MRVKAQGFILFSFAFSSVLSTAEILQIPLVNSNEKTNLEVTSGPIAAENKRTKTPERELEKRSAQDYDREKEEKKGIDGSEIYYDQNESKKRARLGFTGMRGKKEYNPDDFCGDRVRLEGLNLNKRIAKSINDLIEGKRGNVAFYGMRGKKAEDYEGEPLDSYSNEEFLINSGLLDGAEGDEMMSKRSPYSFQGIRGKKKTAYDLKRTMGFLGMRGKKASEVWEPEYNYKRASQTGFYGMKGKKAQTSGFFGMRGKKFSPDAFFGIKEDSEPSELQNFSYLNEDSSRGRFRRGITWMNNFKKGNNFFGADGKKSTEESSRSNSSE